MYGAVPAVIVPGEKVVMSEGDEEVRLMQQEQVAPTP